MSANTLIAGAALAVAVSVIAPRGEAQTTTRSHAAVRLAAAEAAARDALRGRRAPSKA